MDTTFVLTPPPESNEREGTFGPLELQQFESQRELETARAATIQRGPQERSRDERFNIVGKQVDRPCTPEGTVPETLNTRIDTLEISFDGLTKRVDGLRRMLDDMRAEVHGMEGALDALDSIRSSRSSVSTSA